MIDCWTVNIQEFPAFSIITHSLILIVKDELCCEIVVASVHTGKQTRSPFKLQFSKRPVELFETLCDPKENIDYVLLMIFF